VGAPTGPPTGPWSIARRSRTPRSGTSLTATVLGGPLLLLVSETGALTGPGPPLSECRQRLPPSRSPFSCGGGWRPTIVLTPLRRRVPLASRLTALVGPGVLAIGLVALTPSPFLWLFAVDTVRRAVHLPVIGSVLGVVPFLALAVLLYHLATRKPPRKGHPCAGERAGYRAAALGLRAVALSAFPLVFSDVTYVVDEEGSGSTRSGRLRQAGVTPSPLSRPILLRSSRQLSRDCADSRPPARRICCVRALVRR
jgi:hypothetical protein